MKEEKKQLDGNDCLFEIALFLVTSAAGLVNEPPLYGPQRLIMAFCKLADFYKYAPCIEKDELLDRVKAEIERNLFGAKFLKNRDYEGYEKWLNTLVLLLTKELKTRTLGDP